MIKSQDELPEQGRQSEVLIKALEKCEKLEKENKLLKELLSFSRDLLEVECYQNIVEEIDRVLGVK